MRDSSIHRAASALRIALIFAAVTLAVIMQQSPRALLVLLTDGVVAAGILLAASLGGLCLVPRARLGALPLRWRLLLGAGLGIGGLALLTLVLGLAGCLNRTLWIALLAAMGLAGMGRLAWLKRRSGRNPGTDPPDAESQISNLKSDAFRWLWLLAAPFAALTLGVATVPPGLLWAEEGNGYDALEYHLQMPREYLEAGRIAYAAHNVYANFPSNAEMLYLVAMIVEGDAVSGAMVGQMINALLAFLTVAAAWLAGRELSSAVGQITGVLAATCGWLVYLSGVAFVENAMLFFGMLSAAAILRALRPGSMDRAGGMGPRNEPVVPRSTTWLAVAGALAGLSAGCKYTAVVLIAVPLGLMVLAGRWGSHRRRAAALAAFTLSAIGSFAPWMIKNLAFTGNPVFPLAHTIFRSYPEGWSAENAEHFAACHAPAPAESSIAFRLKTLWCNVLADPDQRFGPAAFLLAIAGLFAAIHARGSPGIPVAVAFLAQGVLWLAFTHLYARFAVAFLIPLGILGGRSFANAGAPVRGAGLALLVAGSVWSLGFTSDLYRRHLYADGQRISIEGAPEAFAAGFMPSYEHLKVINGELPAEAKILLVGEARAFYFLRKVDYRVVFNRDSFVELLRYSPAPERVREWLTERRFTHVYVAWSEIRRLSRSRYGFHGLDESQAHMLIDSLTSAGVLRRSHVFTMVGSNAPYAELYGSGRLTGPTRGR